MDIEKISRSVALPIVTQHHYSGGLHNAPTCFGLSLDNRIVAVAAFACPASEHVRAWPFGSPHKDTVTELHRLVMLPRDLFDRPQNALSMFLVGVLKRLHTERPNLRAVISYADSSEGHIGSIYRATNALYFGETKSRSVFYRDPLGKLHHPRLNGVNISKSEAAQRGWTPEVRGVKHKYIYLLGDRRKRQESQAMLLHQPLPWHKVVK